MKQKRAAVVKKNVTLQIVSYGATYNASYY